MTTPPPPATVEPGAALSARRPRRLGRIVGAQPGPTLVAVGGIHGNEPSGVVALERVLSRLRGRAGEMRGELVALTGNLQALAAGSRYVARDLNRCWTAERVADLRARRPEELVVPEDREQRELVDEMEAAFAGARGRTYAVDLHSTSSEGPPFAILSDTLRNRAFVSRLPVPIVLGLEEQLEGTLLAYLSDCGHVSVAFESGQHTSAEAIDHAEGALWLALEAAGLLEPGSIAEAAAAKGSLAAVGAGLPRVVEARYRHGIDSADGFRMQRGWENFQPVRAGEVLAHDHEGEVMAPQTGLILMPLYQLQGDDGFFLVRPFRPFWLKVSAALRRLHADRVVHWLPGVKRHPEQPATFLVNRRVARWFALEIFHLLGFRRKRAAGDHLVVSRRPHDLHADRNGG